MGNIKALLKTIVENFSKRKNNAEALLSDLGINIELVYSIDTGSDIAEMPTFAKKTKKLSPMLLERYKFSSNIIQSPDVWPEIKQMPDLIKSKQVQTLHKSLREHWENSAPALYDDDSLSLFGYTDDVPENIIYLAWSSEQEPHVYVYVGQNQEYFKNLDEFLKWCVNRE